MTIDLFRGEFNWASNFYTGAPFSAHGTHWKTSEHYFAACKTLDNEWAGRIIDAPTPAAAKRYGRNCPLRPDWPQVQLAAMQQALWFKFLQNRDIADRLRATADHYLIEGNRWHDNYWGNCTCGNGRCQKQGKNKLGLLLMNLRLYLMGFDEIAML